MTNLRFTTESAHLAAHERALVRDLDLVPAGDEELDLTLMDTFDGRIVREGGILLRQDQDDDRWLLQWSSLALDTDLGCLSVPRETRLDRDALPIGPVTSRLGQVLNVRALLPMARVRGRVRHWERRDRRGKLVLRLRVDPAITAQAPRGRKAHELRPQIHVIGLQGYESRFERAVDAVRGLRKVTILDEPWAIEVLRAVGREPGRDPSSIDVELDPAAPPRAALRDLCRAYLRVIRANRDGTRAALDPEFLHDFRVAVRRTRALLKASRDRWPRELHDRFRAEFRWLAQQTSTARDLDVYLLDFEDFRRRLPEADRPALGPVRTWLEHAQARSHADLSDALASERLDGLLNDFQALLSSRAFTDDSEGTDTTLEFALAAVDRAHRRLMRDGNRIDASSPDQALHDLRKRAKELRYLLDGFRDLLPRRAVRAQIKALKKLQDNLGLHQDRVVQGETLRRIAHDLEDAPASTLVALGYLIEQLEHDARAHRDEFAARFASYASPRRRKEFEAMITARARRLRQGTA